MKQSFEERFNQRRQLQPDHFDSEGNRRTLRKLPGENFVLMSDKEYAEEMGQRDRKKVPDSWDKEIKTPKELNINGDLGSYIQSSHPKLDLEENDEEDVIGANEESGDEEKIVEPKIMEEQIN